MQLQETVGTRQVTGDTDVSLVILIAVHLLRDKTMPCGVFGSSV